MAYGVVRKTQTRSIPRVPQEGTEEVTKIGKIIIFKVCNSDDLWVCKCESINPPRFYVINKDWKFTAILVGDLIECSYIPGYAPDNAASTTTFLEAEPYCDSEMLDEYDGEWGKSIEFAKSQHKLHDKSAPVISEETKRIDEVAKALAASQEQYPRDWEKLLPMERGLARMMAKTAITVMDKNSIILGDEQVRMVIIILNEYLEENADNKDHWLTVNSVYKKVTGEDHRYLYHAHELWENR
jgi:hypothetical protein